MDYFREEQEETLSFIRFLYRNWIIIASTVAIFTLSAIIVTSFIPPKFHAFGIVFPSSSNSPEDLLENPQFGYEIHADRLMQILESEGLRDSIIKIYDLIEYYEIDKSSIDWKFQLDRKFTSDVTFFRSKYMSIVISARMEDPKLSADIVNSIIDIVDGLQQQILKANSGTILRSIQIEYKEEQDEYDRLLDSTLAYHRTFASSSQKTLLDRIEAEQKSLSAAREALEDLQSKFQFHRLEDQIAQLSRTINSTDSEVRKLEAKRLAFSSGGRPDSLLLELDADLAGAKTQLDIAKSRFDNLVNQRKAYRQLREKIEDGTHFVHTLQTAYDATVTTAEPEITSIKMAGLRHKLELETERLHHLRTKLEAAEYAFDRPFPAVYVVDRAKPSFKKASPSYSLNAGVAAGCGFIFSIVFLFIREKIGAVRKSIKK